VRSPAATLAILALVASALAGCAGSGPETGGGGGGGGGNTNCNKPPPPTLSFSGNIQPIYNRSCATSTACHIGPTSGAGLQLQQGAAYAATVNQPSTQRMLYVVTAVALVGAWALCRWITQSRTGKVLVAIRDSETRVLFSGYSPADYKLFVFVVSAVLAGVAGALYAPQVGIITPAKIGVLPSIEMVVWVAAGGRGTLVGAVLGAIGVNWMQSWLTTSYPDVWLLFLGALFMGVVLFFPDGIVGAAQRLAARLSRLLSRPRTTPLASDAPQVKIKQSV